MEWIILISVIVFNALVLFLDRYFKKKHEVIMKEIADSMANERKLYEQVSAMAIEYMKATFKAGE